MRALKFLAPLLFIFSCGEVADVVDVGPEDLSGAADAYCKANPHLPCGKVYACATEADNPVGLVELCIPQFMDKSQAEALYGACELSPHERFDDANLCWWCCGPGCTAGCNAYSGCFCPAPPPE